MPSPSPQDNNPGISLEAAADLVSMYRRLVTTDFEPNAEGFAGALFDLCQAYIYRNDIPSAFNTAAELVGVCRRLIAVNGGIENGKLAFSLKLQSDLAPNDRVCLPLLTEAVDMQRAICDSGDGDGDSHAELVTYLIRFHKLLRKNASPELANSVQSEVIQRIRYLVSRDPGRFLPPAASAIMEVASGLVGSPRVDEMLALADEAVAYGRKLTGIDFDAGLPILTELLYDHAVILASTGQSSQSLVSFNEATRLSRHSVAPGSPDPEQLPGAALSPNDHFENLAEAVAAVSQAVVNLRAQITQQPQLISQLLPWLQRQYAVFAEAGRKDDCELIAREIAQISQTS